MEAALEVEASADVGDTDLVCESPPGLSKHGEENELDASEEEMESQDTEHTEIEAAVVTSAPVSPLNPSPPQLSSTGETFNTVLVLGSEPDFTSEAEKERTEVKTEKEFQLNEEHFPENYKSLDQSPAEPDLCEDTNMETASDCNKKTNTEDKIEKDSDSEEAIETQQQEESLDSNKLRASTAADDDLDEMMDIGTVDQMEQEAQMKEEECNSLDAESSRSPAISNTGK